MGFYRCTIGSGYHREYLAVILVSIRLFHCGQGVLERVYPPRIRQLGPDGSSRITRTCDGGGRSACL
jgi:hypothetical protein